jgi:hypothetical protein
MALCSFSSPSRQQAGFREAILFPEQPLPSKRAVHFALTCGFRWNGSECFLWDELKNIQSVYMLTDVVFFYIIITGNFFHHSIG